MRNTRGRQEAPPPLQTAGARRKPAQARGRIKAKTATPEHVPEIPGLLYIVEEPTVHLGEPTQLTNSTTHFSKIAGI